MQPKSKILIGVFKSASSGDYNAIKNAPAEGFRLFDLKTGEVSDFNIVKRGEIGKFKNFFKDNKQDIQNLVAAPKGSKTPYKFVNGAESRYPVIDAETGNLVGPNSLIIYGAYEDGFGVIDYAGHRDEWSKDQAVAYAQINGVANGKVVSKNGGSPYLAAISSEYPEIKRKIREVYPEKYTDALDTSPVKEVEPDILTPDKLKNIVQDTKRDKSDKGVSNAVKTQPKEINPVVNKIPVEKAETNPENRPETKQEHNGKVENNKVRTANVADKETLGKKEKVEEALPVQKYTDNFYRQLEPDFGGKLSVMILKYIVEVRNATLETFISLKNRENTNTALIPGLAGLILRNMDTQEDVALSTLLARVVDPAAISLSDALRNCNISVADVYDIGEEMPDRKETKSKYVFKREVLEGCLAKFMKTHKLTLFDLDYSGRVPKYHKSLIDIDGYKLSGVNTDRITITNEDGSRTKVIKLNK